MVSLPGTTATEKKLLQMKALFMWSNLSGILLSGFCAFVTCCTSFYLGAVEENVWSDLLLLCLLAALPLIVSITVSATFACSVTDPALPPAVPSPATVVLPPNAYELAERAVELRHVTAALAAATAEETEGAAAAADAPPGSEPQLRQQLRQQRAEMLRQRIEILELRQALQRSQDAPNEETAAAPREESPSAEVEAELAQMREAAELRQREAALRSEELRRRDELDHVKEMRESCQNCMRWCCYVPLLCLVILTLSDAVAGVYTYTSLGEQNPSAWAVKIYLRWMMVCLPLSTGLLLVSARCLTQYERLAEQHMTTEMVVPAEKAKEEVADTPHKMLLSEESEAEK